MGNLKEFIKLTENIYLLPFDHSCDRPTLGAISGEKGTLVVDAGNSPAHAELFLSGLKDLIRSPARYLALTHWHWDHVFGIAMMNLPTIAQRITNEKLIEMARYAWNDKSLDERVRDGREIAFCRDNIIIELPDRSDLEIATADIIFENRLEVDLGDLTCRIENVGGDHSADSSVIYIPEEKVLFLGDCMNLDLYQPVWTFTTAKLYPLIDKILSYDALYYVDSHHPPVNREELEQDFSELRFIGATVEEKGGNRDAILAIINERMANETDPSRLEIIKRNFSHYLEPFISYY